MVRPSSVPSIRYVLPDPGGPGGEPLGGLHPDGPGGQVLVIGDEGEHLGCRPGDDHRVTDMDRHPRASGAWHCGRQGAKFQVALQRPGVGGHGYALLGPGAEGRTGTGAVLGAGSGEGSPLTASALPFTGSTAIGYGPGAGRRSGMAVRRCGRPGLRQGGHGPGGDGLPSAADAAPSAVVVAAGRRDGPSARRWPVDAVSHPQRAGGVTGRSPAGCPVAVSFAAAWVKLTPMRWTSPAARISSISACRSDP